VEILYARNPFLAISCKLLTNLEITLILSDFQIKGFFLNPFLDYFLDCPLIAEAILAILRLVSSYKKAFNEANFFLDIDLIFNKNRNVL